MPAKCRAEDRKKRHAPPASCRTGSFLRCPDHRVSALRLREMTKRKTKATIRYLAASAARRSRISSILPADEAIACFRALLRVNFTRIVLFQRAEESRQNVCEPVDAGLNKVCGPDSSHR